MAWLEPRPQPSARMRLFAPLLAVALTLASGAALMWALGLAPGPALAVFFVAPLREANGWSELALKAAPLILIAQGLAIGFKARIYNIGAEGQFILGAICGGGVALALDGSESALLTRLTLPLMLLAGAAGGAAWGALPAWLKTRYRTDETLTTLMLAYVAVQILSYLLHGPWRDPDGLNFPQTILFGDAALFAPLLPGLRINASVFLVALVVGVFWLFVGRSLLAYQLEVGGQAPAAARYAGFDARRTVWVSLTLSGLCAGIAGVCEVAGPIGQLNLNLSPGYGFAAIIVAFLGRLHPLGVVFAGLLMALVYLGGEAAQITLQLPAAITGVFQGLLLFYLLACDSFVDYRLRRRPRAAPAAQLQEVRT